jgi:hypothetical protein
MGMLTGISGRAKEGGRRLAAVLGQWLGRTSGGGSKTPIFIVGCQRSGTTMSIRILDNSPQIKVYGEGNKAAFREGFRVRSEATLRSLIRNSREPIVVFKPINDTQNIDRLLLMQPNAKAIWIYRHFYDVVNSMVQKWGDVQKRTVHQIATGTYSGPGAEALGERISAANLVLARKLDDRGLSANDAAAFIWFLRNSIYFDLKLDVCSNVLLCNYEDMVSNPEWYFRRIFNFVGDKFSSRYVADVLSSSIHKREAPVMDAEIMHLCEGLMNRINEQHRLQLEMEQTNTSAVKSA